MHHYPLARQQFQPNQGEVQNHDRSLMAGHNHVHNSELSQANGYERRRDHVTRDERIRNHVRLPAAGYQIAGLTGSGSHHTSPYGQEDDRKIQPRISPFYAEEDETPLRSMQVQEQSFGKYKKDTIRPKSRPIRAQPPANFEDEPIRPSGSPDALDESNPFGVKIPPKRRNADSPPPLPKSIATAKDQAVECFGEKLLSYIYSKEWVHRSKGFKDLQNRWESDDFERNEVTAFKLTSDLANDALKDRVTSVILAGTEIILYLWENHSGCINGDASFRLMAPLTDNLVKQLASSNIRVADASKNCLIFLGEQPKVGPLVIFTSLLKDVGRRDSKSKLARLRNTVKFLEREGEVIGKMLEQKLPKGISVSEIMVRVLKMLNHKDGKARNVGVNLATELYESFPKKLPPMLDSLNDYMKETLNQAFLERTGAANVLERSEPSQKEQNRPSKTMAQAFTVEKKSRKKKKTKKKRVRKTNPKPEPEPEIEEFHEPEVENDYDNDVTDRCNFCGVQDASFAEDEKNLDFHFWQCPMLVECNHCSQLIDIPSLWAHLLEECEEAPKHQACPRCTQPIPVTMMEEHLHMEPQCRVAKPLDQANRCPLCLKDIEPNEEGWNYHILVEKCQQNQEP